jgi:hypothetical protein
MPTVFRDVRFQGQSGKHLLALSFPVLTLSGRHDRTALTVFSTAALTAAASSAQLAMLISFI